MMVQPGGLHVDGDRARVVRLIVDDEFVGVGGVGVEHGCHDGVGRPVHRQALGRHRDIVRAQHPDGSKVLVRQQPKGIAAQDILQVQLAERPAHGQTLVVSLMLQDPKGESECSRCGHVGTRRVGGRGHRVWIGVRDGV